MTCSSSYGRATHPACTSAARVRGGAAAFRSHVLFTQAAAVLRLPALSIHTEFSFDNSHK